MNRRGWIGLDINTNPLGMGCWQISGNYTLDNKPQGWGNVDENLALEILEEAINSGIDFFDTAQGYNFGQSEHLLGTAIKNTGKQVVVCTKIPLTPLEITENKIGSDFCNRVEKSLENLNLSRIDILLIHNPPDDLIWSNFDYRVLDMLVNVGTIGTYGVSSKSISGAKNVIENKVGTTLEWVFNIFERRPIKDLFPLIDTNQFNFIARSPLSRGLINNKYLDQDPAFDSDDFRSTLPMDWVNWTINQVRAYHNKCGPGNNIVKNAIDFCLHFKEVNALIVGIKTKQQLREYLSFCAFGTSGFNLDSLYDISDCFPNWK